MSCTNQEDILRSVGSECSDDRKAISRMVDEISRVLSDCNPSVYLHGSMVLDDFRPGWSDLDILVLSTKQMSQQQAGKLLKLRQALLQADPGNTCYRLFEGGMLTLDAFLSGSCDRVVYWGTSGERICGRYALSSFDVAVLIERGSLLYGRDLRCRMNMPDYGDFHADVKRHYEAMRRHAKKTGRSLYSFGWLLDIARCLYTLRTGRVIAKTAAAEWALENDLCPVPAALRLAVKIRRAPLEYRDDQRMMDVAEGLGEAVQCFADVLESELRERRIDGAAEQSLS